MRAKVLCLKFAFLGLLVFSCTTSKELNPPKFAATPELSPHYVKKDAVVTLKFEPDIDLRSDPDVRVRMTGSVRNFTLDKSRTSGRKYVFTYVAVGDETEMVDSPVVVTMTGNSGGKTEDAAAGAVIFDFKPPLISPGSQYVRLASDYPANPVLDVKAVTNGTVVTVAFNLTEDLYADPADSAKNSPLPKVVYCMVPDCDPLRQDAVLVLQQDFNESSGRAYVFRGRAADMPKGMDFDSKVYIVPSEEGGIFDLAGNVLNDPLEVTPLAIKTTIPEAPSVANVFYRRIPWGMKDPATGAFVERKYSVVCNACMFSAEIEMVLIYDSIFASSGGFIGLAQNPHIGGPWTVNEIILNGSDRANVYMVAADTAGNISPVSQIKDTEWIATMGYKVPGSTWENPHTFMTSGLFSKTLEQSMFVQEPAVFDQASPRQIRANQVGKYQGWSEWIESDQKPSSRELHAMAYDSARGKVVLFGGFAGGTRAEKNETWEWDGKNWKQLTPSTSPSARYDHAMVYDAAMGKVVLFGGHSGTDANNETWEWDGTNWTRLNPALSPPATSGHAMAFDNTRGKVVLFGGFTEARNSETWEWDGTNWTKLNPAISPSARASHAMAFDSTKGKVVMFGGYIGNSNYSNETWEWDGTNWTQLNPATSPSARICHAMVYDNARGKVVLFGGYTSYFNNETWEWDGTNWMQLNPAKFPSARYGHAMAYDSIRGRAVLFGGMSETGVNDETWEWDGAYFTRLNSAACPSARYGHAMAYDSVRGKVVLFGGYPYNNETWEWDGINWVQLNPATRPFVRAEHAMAYDSARDKVVLFGGNTGTLDNETWEWDGINWTKLNPVTFPSSRYGHAMAYDSVRGKVVLFGGNAATFNNETWEWDGTNWTRLTPATSPSARSNHAMVYDNTRGKVILFGGCQEGYSSICLAYNGENWEWDGMTWTQFKSATPPYERSGHAMAYDSIRGRAVLFGGQRGVYNNETWEWDGAKWVQMNPATRPSGRSGHAMAYDSARGRVVLFGGYYGSTSNNETWEWDGKNWMLLNPATRPSERWWHAMAYDSARGKVVLFGGYRFTTGSIWNSETWEWDGTNWTRLNPVIHPSARRFHAMAFDSARGKVVLFGGDVGGDENDETWEWDGTNWTQLNPVTRPQTREGHAMAYDSDRGRVFLFGGHYNSGVDQYLNDVMEWDGKNWSQKFSVANPSPRAYNALAYDVARGKVLLFGGGHYSGDFRIFDDTWEWDEKKGWMQKTPDVIPVPHSSHALAYDGMRGRVIMFGGARSFSQNDTWEWDGQGNGRPGQVLNVFFKATGVISSTYEPQVKNLNVKFASGGIGYPQGVVTEGVNLMAWYDNEWHTVASNSNGPKAPGLVEWNTTDEKMIWKLLYSGGMNFNFAVVPLAPNGFGHPNCPSDWTAEECDMGMVSTEYVEVTLRYSLP